MASLHEVMYGVGMAMRRFQMMIDEELDEALERAAGEPGASKAQLLRDFARERPVDRPARRGDPLDRLAGIAGPDEVADEHTGRAAEHVTDVLYGSRSS